MVCNRLSWVCDPRRTRPKANRVTAGNVSSWAGAGGGTRTPTRLAPRRILSPLRLPIPPLRHACLATGCVGPALSTPGETVPGLVPVFHTGLRSLPASAAAPGAEVSRDRWAAGKRKLCGHSPRAAPAEPHRNFIGRRVPVSFGPSAIECASDWDVAPRRAPRVNRFAPSAEAVQTIMTSRLQRQRLGCGLQS
jgi:hypothetical protein